MMMESNYDEWVEVAVAANHRYLCGLKATLVSMINASSDKKIRFHVFADGLPDSDCEEVSSLVRRFGYDEPIDFIHPDMHIVEDRFKSYNGSCTTYLRLFFPLLLKNLDWVLWADVDTLWFRDPKELWVQRDQTVSVLWARDHKLSQKIAASYANERWHCNFDAGRYCCAGVLLMNLKKMRTAGFVDSAIAFATKWKTTLFADQDILNELCYDDAKIVDDCWDVLNPVRISDKFVLHFNGIGRMWDIGHFVGRQPLYEIWFRYYEQIVKGNKHIKVGTFYNRLIMNIFGLVYWPEPIVRLLTFRMSEPVADGVRMYTFYAWLRKKKLWSKAI